MFSIKRIWLNRDKKLFQEWSSLLVSNELAVDTQVDYTIGIFNENQLIGTASLYQNIIKCVSVSSDYQGNDLLAKLVTHLLEYLKEQMIFHTFLYTKPESAILFKGLGFEEIIRTDQVVFMEFGQPNFDSFLEILNQNKQSFKTASSIVMNANPFTLGHYYLIKEASKQSEWVYVFVVSENSSEFSSDERMELVKQGCASLTNVTILPTMTYQVSSATFPSYFLKERAELDVAKTQATLDAKLFKEKIAKALNIKKRFVGDEPYSKVTNIYNEAMKTEFQTDIELIILNRKEVESEIISATKVRKAYEEKNWSKIKKMVPETTYNYLLTRGE
ncbi:[citrate (pro-3S)-lyase] ligase [Vagococcus carniphilus]|uniref:[Citrate [pro-3S]-lyase] ligase n=1 Tax=Vagococcus carniphilus TaxID=218144 RepID=A0AAW8U1P9_9ENTE|nr:[citrate (pro-3S)-lyase] ligase [Vagococcus carniphilus]MDT2833463.1 [citrate (pro-3S)-lyase] ligase [Vagococcus carniphilus]